MVFSSQPFFETCSKNVLNFETCSRNILNFETCSRNRKNSYSSVISTLTKIIYKLNKNFKLTRQLFKDMFRHDSCHHQFRFFQSIPIAIAATPIVLNCSTWSFIMASRTRQATMIIKTAPASPFIRHYSWKVLKDCTLYKNRWEGLQRNLSSTISLCNPSVLREGTSLWEIF